MKTAIAMAASALSGGVGVWMGGAMYTEDDIVCDTLTARNVHIVDETGAFSITLSTDIDGDQANAEVGGLTIVHKQGAATFRTTLGPNGLTMATVSSDPSLPGLRSVTANPGAVMLQKQDPGMMQPTVQIIMLDDLFDEHEITIKELMSPDD